MAILRHSAELDASGFRRGAKDAESAHRKFAKGVAQSNKNIKTSIGGLSTGFAKFGAAAAAALGGIGFAKLIGDAEKFDTAFTRVQTLLGNTSPLEAFGATADEVKGQLLAMSGGLGDVESLTNAAYDAISAGTKPAQALDLVRKSAELAATGIGDTAKNVDGMSTIMEQYGLASDDAATSQANLARVSDVMFQTFTQGKNISDLGKNLARVAPIASSVGVSLEDVGASVATLTLAGKTTSQATRGLASVFEQLQGSASKFADKGVDIVAVLREQGLAGALEAVQAASGGTIEGMKQLGVTGSALDTVLTLTGSSAGRLSEVMGNFASGSGAAAGAFGKVEQSAKFLREELTGKLGAVFTRIGDVLIKTFAPALGSAADAMGRLLQSQGLNTFLSGLQAGLASIGSAFTAIANSQSAVALFESLQARAQGLFQVMQNLGQSGAGQALASAFGSLISVVDAVVAKVIQGFSLIDQAILSVFSSSQFQGFAADVTATFSSLFSQAQAGLQVFADAFGQVKAFIVGQLSSLAGDPSVDIGAILGKGLDLFVGALQLALNGVKTLVFGVKAGFVGIPKIALDAGIAIGRALVEPILHQVGELLPKLASVFGKIPGLGKFEERINAAANSLQDYTFEAGVAGDISEAMGDKLAQMTQEYQNSLQPIKRVEVATSEVKARLTDAAPEAAKLALNVKKLGDTAPAAAAGVGAVSAKSKEAAKSTGEAQRAADAFLGSLGLVSQSGFDAELARLTAGFELIKGSADPEALNAFNVQLDELVTKGIRSGNVAVEAAEGLSQQAQALSVAAQNASAYSGAANQASGETIKLGEAGLSVTQIVSGLGQSFGSIGQGLVALAQDGFGKLGAALGSALTGAQSFGDAFGSVFKSIGGSIKGLVSGGLANTVSGAFSSLFANASAKSGKVLGGLLGAAGGPLGSALGSAAGAVAGKLVGKIGGIFGGLFGGKPAFKKVQEDVEKNLGVALSEGTANAIADISKSLGVDRSVATLIGLPEIIKEADIASDNFGAFALEAVKGLELIGRGGEVGAKALESTNESYGLLISKAEELGETSGGAFQQMILAARQSGAEIEAVSEFIDGRLKMAVEGIGKVFGGIFGDDGEFSGGIERLNDLSVIMGNIADAVIAEGGDINELIPQIDQLIEAHKKLGEEGSEAYQKLVAERNFLKDNAGVLEAVGGLTQVTKGLGESTFLTSEAFVALQNEGVRAFNSMIESGASHERSLQAIAPLLQEQVNQANARGEALSGQTAELAAQAAELGLIELQGTSLTNSLKTGFDRVISAITGMPIEAAASFGMITQSGVASASTTGTAWQGAASDTSTAWQGAANSYGVTVTEIQNTTATATTAMLGAQNDATNAMMATAEAAGSATIAAADNTVGRVADLTDRVKNKLDALSGFRFDGSEFGELADTFNLPRFARGGRYPAGTPIMVGEEGREIVRFDRPGVIATTSQLSRLERAIQSNTGTASPATATETTGDGEVGSITVESLHIHVGDEVFTPKIIKVIGQAAIRGDIPIAASAIVGG